MNEAAASALEALWRGAVGVVPLALVAALVVRVFSFRPATRHCLWATVLTWTVLAPLLPHPPRAGLVPAIPSPDEPDAAELASSVDASFVEKEGDAVKAVSLSRQPARPALVAPASLAQADGAVGLPRENPAPASPGVTDDGQDALTPGATPGEEISPGRLVVRGPVITPREPLYAAESTLAPPVSRRFVCPAPVTPRELESADPRFMESDRDQGAENRSPFDNASFPRAVTPYGVEPGTLPVRGLVRLPIPMHVPEEQVGQTGMWSTRGLRQDSFASEPAWTWRDSLVPILTAAQTIRTWALQSWAALGGALAAAPPVPLEAWLTGALLFLMWKLARLMRGRHLLRLARPAPARVLREVREIAQALGLRHPPETLMIHAAVSPMVWCGRGVRLLLPADLWDQLDPAGRRAVLCHELAHIKRRDHWVLWLEQLVACLYWWHPVVWWVRKRVNEEAENCCDAWVTWLLPQGRRAYAQALLQTTHFVQSKAVAVPPVGIGAVSGRAERFARRINMVMTHSAKPRLSGAGLMMAAVLALGGWLTAPAQSCPDHAKAQAGGGAGCGSKCANKCVKGGCGHAQAGVAGTAGVALAGDRDEVHERSRGELEERMARLEAQLERLSEQLERMGESAEDGVKAEGGKVKRRGPMPAPHVFGIPGEPVEVPVPPGSWEVPAPPSVKRVDRGQIVTRAYPLPEGKLEAVTKLMVRSDVPIRVRPLDGRIEVQGNEREHAIFKGFIDLISDKKQVRGYRVSPGKLEDLNELMVRSDVPIRVEPGREVIKVHGSPLEQSVFEAFVDMIDPGVSVREAHGNAGEPATFPRQPREPRAPRAPRAPMARGAHGHASPCGSPERCREMEMKLSQAIREAQNKAQDGMRKVEEAQQRMREKSQELRERRKQMRGHRADGEQGADEEIGSDVSLEETVARLSEIVDVGKVNQLIELLASIDVQAALNSDPQQREHAEHQIQHLLEQAEALESQARGIEDEAHAMVARTAEIEAHAEAMSAESEADDTTAELLEQELAHVARGGAREEMALRAELLRAEAEAIAAQQNQMEGAAESLYEQAEALQEAAEALRVTVEPAEIEEVEAVEEALEAEAPAESE